MCIIATKAPGVRLPARKTFDCAAVGNPDGCGLAVHRPGGHSVTIRKGFSPGEFYEVARKMVRREDAAVFHWRLATHGDKTGAMTHPFPVAERAEKLRATSYSGPCALAHNGMFSRLPADPDGLSDTAVFCRLLARTGIAHRARRPGGSAWRDVIEPLIDGSRVAIIWRDGTIHRYGARWEKDADGTFWSNVGYLPVVESRATVCDWQSSPSFGSRRFSLWREEEPRFADECCECGEEIRDWWVWCPACGTDLEDQRRTAL